MDEAWVELLELARRQGGAVNVAMSAYKGQLSYSIE
jgi:hypothetical protein